MQKLDPYFTQYTRINSKWITDLNVRVKTIKFLGGKKKSEFSLSWVTQWFLDIAPKAQMTRKNRWIEFPQNCKILYIKGSHQESENNPWNERKYLKFICDKELVSRIYKELLEFNNKRQSSLKMAKTITETDISPKIHKWLISRWEDLIIICYQNHSEIPLHTH